MLCVAAPLAPTAEACRRLARRALGPHGSQVPALGVAVADVDAQALALAAAALVEVAAASGEAPLPESWALVVSIGLGPDGTTVALCLGR